jgi:hypothetical protein
VGRAGHANRHRLVGFGTVHDGAVLKGLCLGLHVGPMPRPVHAPKQASYQHSL